MIHAVISFDLRQRLFIGRRVKTKQKQGGKGGKHLTKRKIQRKLKKQQ